jgi:hypothetical protein
MAFQALEVQVVERKFFPLAFWQHFSRVVYARVVFGSLARLLLRVGCLLVLGVLVPLVLVDRRWPEGFEILELNILFMR